MPAPLKSAIVTIGLPVFNGVELVPETLRAIRDQTFQNYRVLVSVDGDDQASAVACRPFLNDTRIELVVRQERLGWARNLNSLIERCQSAFFCYWQQDDLADTSYLERLVEHAVSHPEAACSYADVQWFGSAINRKEQPSITGPALDRALAALFAPANWIPFRGLIRGDALRKVGPLRTGHAMSSLEDKTWVVKLAGEGELHRVPKTLYFKRAHATSTHKVWHGWPADQRREAWLTHGVGLLEVLLPLAGREERPRVLAKVVDRLLGLEQRGWRFYDGIHEKEAFVTDLLRMVEGSVIAPAVKEAGAAIVKADSAQLGVAMAVCRAGFLEVGELLVMAGSKSCGVGNER